MSEYWDVEEAIWATVVFRHRQTGVVKDEFELFDNSDHLVGFLAGISLHSDILSFEPSFPDEDTDNRWKEQKARLLKEINATPHNPMPRVCEEHTTKTQKNFWRKIFG